MVIGMKGWLLWVRIEWLIFCCEEVVKKLKVEKRTEAIINIIAKTETI